MCGGVAAAVFRVREPPYFTIPIAAARAEARSNYAAYLSQSHV